MRYQMIRNSAIADKPREVIQGHHTWYHFIC